LRERERERDCNDLFWLILSVHDEEQNVILIFSFCSDGFAAMQNERGKIRGKQLISGTCANKYRCLGCFKSVIKKIQEI
jgi:hypothetical protein